MLRRPELAPYRPDAARGASPDDDDDQDGDGEREEDATDGEPDGLETLRAMTRRYLVDDEDDPRVVLAFPTDPDHMLLSGTLSGGEALAGRAQVVDSPLGEGHVVQFAIRPFWRWQTQGTFFLGFNAILNWNDLDAGRKIGDADEAEAGDEDR
jgi:hypothetical protein